MTDHKDQEPSFLDMRLNRRDFLKRGAVAATGMAALVAALSPLRHLDEFINPEEFFQKHYKEMTPKEMARVLERLSEEIEEQYKIRPEIRDIKPMDGVSFAYALNLSRCIGCRRCV